jgi:thiopeptide-type bacteriocin biosynthesis protein
MRSDPPKVDFGKREAHILRRLGQHLAAGTREWKLSDDDVEVLSDGERAPLPDAFAVVARVSATSAEGISSGDFCVSVNGLSGPSGAMLLGRFCHGDDELRRRVEEHLRSEEAARPEAIFAEVVHLAEGRLGNILCRPSLRSYDIPYLGRSGLPEARQIPVADLRIGLKNGQLSLFSARHLREVVPRLTSAHSFANAALGIYRFLCALRDEGRTHAFGWSWGALAASPFLPRVSRGRVVLAAAQWNLAQDELRALDRQSEESAYRAIQELRRRLALPRWVGLVDGDNVLPVDLDDVLQVTSLVRLVHAREGAVLVEPPGRPVVQGPEGSFVHDLVVPYVCTREAPTVSADAVARHHVAADDVRSTFTPGSEWTYAKLYTGTAGADAVLTQVVAPLLARLGEAGEPLCWFYVRYGDPRWHVRLRVRCRDARQGTAVVPGLLHEAVAPLLADGRIWKVQLDTYEREVNRYGGPGAIETCETIFQADSDACLAIAELLDADSGADARWKLTFRGMHLLLHDFGIEADGRIGVLRQIRAALGREHGLDVHIERQMGAKFRAERPRLEALLSPTWDGEDELEPGLAHLATRSERLAPLVAELSALQRKGRLTGSLSSIVGALLHMHANRLLRSEQRAQELLLYDFLLRLYESQVARARKGGKAARGS